MASGIRCFRLLHPAFRSYHAALTRPVSEVSMKTVSGRQHGHRQYSAYPAVPVRHFATKKAKDLWRWSYEKFMGLKLDRSGTKS
uniref:Mitochondrial ribosome recycling factor n=1 Tax=Mus musculus TaxID=10090 RepID=E0CYT0_MOUSE